MDVKEIRGDSYENDSQKNRIHILAEIRETKENSFGRSKGWLKEK